MILAVSNDNFAIRLAERSSALFLVPKSTIRFLRDIIKNIAMLNASVALYTPFRSYFIAPR